MLCPSERLFLLKKIFYFMQKISEKSDFLMIEREMFNANGGVSMTDIEKITIDALVANNVLLRK